LAAIAFAAGDRERMLHALQVGCASPALTSGLISALGWLNYSDISPWIAKLLEARSPEHRLVGVAACAIHRNDPGDALTRAVDDPDPALRARALRAVGELRRDDLANRLRDCLDDADETCRFWAAWSLAVNRHRSGVSRLTTWFEHQVFGERALQVALRAMPLDEGRDWVPARRHGRRDRRRSGHRALAHSMDGR